MLRLVILLGFILSAGTVSAQTADTWFDEALKLKREGWGERVSPVLPDRTRPVAPLIAFVSFSMPDESLKAILEQVNRAGGSVVLRGLVNNNFKDTATMVAELARENGPGFSVDPKLFAKYRISAVPSFVVPDGDTFDRITGNISLDAALQTIILEGKNKKAARKLLKKLRGSTP